MAFFIQISQLVGTYSTLQNKDDDIGDLGHSLHETLIEFQTKESFRSPWRHLKNIVRRERTVEVSK